MSSEIQFGELEHNEPNQGVRPDRDGHFCIAQVGELGEDELPIFVDLDVMRDMEAHAISNTRVELGGVMLGHQCIDEHGKPFVVISDSLRALHYQATRGSFKFTHETWNQITNQRNQFKPDLEMVGWYHTHPGWTVFLSPMDLFICDNFFNRPLDVALVIDPCAQDRGWFQWDEEKQTQRTGGFFITTNRYREDELLHFARIYNKEPDMNVDPRYSSHPVGMNHQTPVVTMDTRNPLANFLLVGLFLTQLCFLAWMGWLMTKSSNQQSAATESAPTEQSSSVEVESLKSALSIVSSQAGQADVGEKIAELETQRKQLAAGLDGQIARTELLAKERDGAVANFNQIAAQKSELNKKLDLTREKLDDVKLENEELLTQLEKAAEGKNLNGYSLTSLLGCGLFATLLGGLTGYFFAGDRREDFDDFDQKSQRLEEPRRNPSSGVEFETDSSVQVVPTSGNPPNVVDEVQDIARKG